MSQSQCPSVTEKEVKKRRIKEVEEKSEEFFRGVIRNLLIPDGITGKVDIAFKIPRKQIIARVLRKLAKELEDGDSI